MLCIFMCILEVLSNGFVFTHAEVGFFTLTTDAKLFSKALGPTAMCKRFTSSNMCIVSSTFANSSRCKAVSYESPITNEAEGFFWNAYWSYEFPILRNPFLNCTFPIVVF